jgi:hypothetical protein
LNREIIPSVSNYSASRWLSMKMNENYIYPYLDVSTNDVRELHTVRCLEFTKQGEFLYVCIGKYLHIFNFDLYRIKSKSDMIYFKPEMSIPFPQLINFITINPFNEDEIGIGFIASSKIDVMNLSTGITQSYQTQGSHMITAIMFYSENIFVFGDANGLLSVYEKQKHLFSFQQEKNSSVCSIVERNDGFLASFSCGEIIWLHLTASKNNQKSSAFSRPYVTELFVFKRISFSQYGRLTCFVQNSIDGTLALMFYNGVIVIISKNFDSFRIISEAFKIEHEDGTYRHKLDASINYKNSLRFDLQSGFLYSLCFGEEASIVIYDLDNYKKKQLCLLKYPKNISNFVLHPDSDTIVTSFIRDLKVTVKGFV